MAAYDHHFMPLDPPPATAEEWDALVTLATINFHTADSGYVLIVRFLGTDSGVSVIAVTIPEIAAGHADQDKWMAHGNGLDCNKADIRSSMPAVLHVERLYELAPADGRSRAKLWFPNLARH